MVIDHPQQAGDVDGLKSLAGFMRGCESGLAYPSDEWTGPSYASPGCVAGRWYI